MEKATKTSIIILLLALIILTIGLIQINTVQKQINEHDKYWKELCFPEFSLEFNETLYQIYPENEPIKIKDIK